MNTLTVATREPLVARLSQVARKVTAVLDFLSPAVDLLLSPSCSPRCRSSPAGWSGSCATGRISHSSSPTGTRPAAAGGGCSRSCAGIA